MVSKGRGHNTLQATLIPPTRSRFDLTGQPGTGPGRVYITKLDHLYHECNSMPWGPKDQIILGYTT